MRTIRQLWAVFLVVGTVVVISSQAIAGSYTRLFSGTSQDPPLDFLTCGGMSMMTYLGLYG